MGDRIEVSRRARSSEDAMEEKLGLIDPEVFRDMELLISIMIFLEDDFHNTRGLN